MFSSQCPHRAQASLPSNLASRCPLRSWLAALVVPAGWSCFLPGWRQDCDQDISMHLPATHRSRLIALEDAPGYSDEAFERCCVIACKARGSLLDRAAFAQDVCGVQGTALASSKPDRGRLLDRVRGLRVLVRRQAGSRDHSVPLAEVVAAFGQPRNKSPTPHE